MATAANSASRDSKRAGAVRVTALQLGIVAGIAAVIAGSLLEVRPPDAYGICMACHGRDLLNWTINRIAATHLTIAPASLVFPVLTTIGVLLGAVLGSKTSREFRWSSPDNSLKTFIYGAAVMISALIAGVILGYLGQRSRMCFVGGIRDFILVRDTYLLRGLFAFGLTAWLAFPL